MDLQRIVFAGGDTSSYAMRKIGADALEISVFDQEQSGHVCRLVSSDLAVDGVEVVLKGGQVGGDDFLLRAKAGTISAHRGSSSRGPRLSRRTTLRPQITPASPRCRWR